MPPKLTRLYCADEVVSEAMALADVCELEVVQQPPRRETPLLYWDQQGLSLVLANHRQPFRLYPDKLRRRLSATTDLQRACGVTAQGGGRTESRLRILDVFAGFCTDALALALAGAEVHAVEKVPEVYCLSRVLLQSFDVPLTLQLGDGLQVLRELGELREQSELAEAKKNQWDVVYLDPMFTPRSKAALPGLPAQVLRELNPQTISDEEEGEAYLQQALRVAAKVVFKRPLKDPVIARPNHQFKGRSVRFDVYVRSPSRTALLTP